MITLTREQAAQVLTAIRTARPWVDHTTAGRELDAAGDMLAALVAEAISRRVDGE